MHESISIGLLELNAYCRRYFSTQWTWKETDVLEKFWRITDDRLYYGVLGFLPDYISFEVARDGDAPEGFLLAIPVMMMEGAYIADGWSTFLNLQSDLPLVIEAYRKIGLPEEAGAVEGVLEMLKCGIEDESRLVLRYKSAGSPYSDDHKREKFLRAYFCRNRWAFDFVSPKV